MLDFDQLLKNLSAETAAFSLDAKELVSVLNDESISTVKCRLLLSRLFDLNYIKNVGTLVYILKNIRLEPKFNLLLTYFTPEIIITILGKGEPAFMRGLNPERKRLISSSVVAQRLGYLLDNISPFRAHRVIKLLATQGKEPAGIKTLLPTWRDWKCILNHLTISNSPFLLNHLLESIATPANLCAFLEGLSSAQEEKLMEHCGNHIAELICDGNSLAKILSESSNPERLLNKFTPEKLKTVIGDYEQLVCILQRIPSIETRHQLMEMLGATNIRSMITDWRHLAELLQCFPTTDQQFQLYAMLEDAETPEFLRRIFFQNQTVDQAVKTITKSVYNNAQIYNSLLHGLALAYCAQRNVEMINNKICQNQHSAKFEKQTHHTKIGKRFGKSSADEKIEGGFTLATLIASNNQTFFKTMNRADRKVLESGRLGKITKAFRAHSNSN